MLICYNLAGHFIIDDVGTAGTRDLCGGRFRIVGSILSNQKNISKKCPTIFLRTSSIGF